MLKPNSAFDWTIYADATFAGLSVLIPVIGLDWLAEAFFRRRIPSTIAEYREQPLPPNILSAVRQNPENWDCLQTCLLLPILAIIWTVKRLSKKILYFLTIKEAAEKISYYWQQAFLMDYALQAGHLTRVETARTARQAIESVVETDVTDSLYQLAWQITTGVKHLFRMLNAAWRGNEHEGIKKTRQEMRRGWAQFADDLEALAEAYARTYGALTAEGPADTASTEEKDNDLESAGG